MTSFLTLDIVVIDIILYSSRYNTALMFKQMLDYKFV